MALKWTKKTPRSTQRKYHILFWLVYFTFNVIRWGSYFDDYWYSLKSNLVEFPLHIIIVYFNLYYLLPKFILTKKHKQYIFYIFISLGVLYIVRTGLNYLLVTKDILPEAESVQKAFTFNHIVAVVLGELYVLALVTAIKLTVDWVYERRKAESFQKIQLETELKFLKTQIQPHFFFNTLNNLYALTIEKSDKAPEVVLKLSEIMEYILYEAKGKKISLYNEIKYVQNYIDLEKLRYGDRVKVDLSIQGNVENVQVPPLLFLPFIENCFKHGTKDNNYLNVFIYFEKTTDKLLTFSVVNNYNQFTNKVKNHGIGNKNIKRRLELLFKDKFTLEIKGGKQNYSVNLMIPLE
ncbi:MAG: histidine kinase [Polaribacter sp.]|nr:histidine kinase [Polaribacter sp.]